MLKVNTSTEAGELQSTTFPTGDDDDDDDDAAISPDAPFFHGFARSPEFERLFDRLEILEQWKELVMRPEFTQVCHPEDMDLWENPELRDNYSAFAERCQSVRRAMNQALPRAIETTVWDDDLVVQTSRIPDSGKGLFYFPRDASKSIPPDTVVCYYTGHIHTHESSQHLENSYLLSVKNGMFVNPADEALSYIKARYINDPKNSQAINCEYVAEEYRAAIRTTREVQPKEEFYVSYGEAYWSQSPFVGHSLSLPANES